MTTALQFKSISIRDILSCLYDLWILMCHSHFQLFFALLSLFFVWSLSFTRRIRIGNVVRHLLYIHFHIYFLFVISLFLCQKLRIEKDLKAIKCLWLMVTRSKIMIWVISTQFEFFLLRKVSRRIKVVLGFLSKLDYLTKTLKRLDCNPVKFNFAVS